MKIATFNINNINKRLANLLDWLEAARPDVVCLQELKAHDTELSARGDREGRLQRGLARRRNRGTASPSSPAAASRWSRAPSFPAIRRTSRAAISRRR